MIDDQEVFFHVGLGKVASTYLQKEVFPRLHGVKYISTHQYKKSKELIRRCDTKKVLVSREFDRQFEQEVRWFTRDFPNARVIILLRRQDDWAASQYKRHVKNGFFGDFEDFIDVDNDQGYWKLKEFRYQPKLDVIEECSSIPPLILFYEDLTNEPKSVLKKMTDYMGIAPLEEVSLKKVHASFSEKQLKMLRAFCKKYVGVIPKNHVNKTKHWTLYRPVWAFYHLILYLAGLLPGGWVSRKPLIAPEALKKVRMNFADDWEKVKKSPYVK